ncbi:MAG: hypothetical protein J6C33_08625 [Lachnospiraceae bacterium]|nr:hypothetical protein [Lachnospiraceae bacterium]
MEGITSNGRKIPVLTLDNKWHKLFTQTGSTPEIASLSEKLNDLLKRQGKLNNEIKEIKRLKKKLMDNIVASMNAVSDTEEKSSGAEKKMEESRRLIEECNEKLEEYEDECLELPRQIDAVNYKLMLATMEICYDRLQSNAKEIGEIGSWIAKTRVELKKKLLKKQESEIENHNLYSYMHDIFGAEVLEIFDMEYNPDEQIPEKKTKEQ